MRLSTDMNLKEAQEYANKLKKAEKMQKLREEVGRRCRWNGRRTSSWCSEYCVTVKSSVDLISGYF